MNILKDHLQLYLSHGSFGHAHLREASLYYWCLPQMFLKTIKERNYWYLVHIDYSLYGTDKGTKFAVNSSFYFALLVWGKNDVNIIVIGILWEIFQKLIYTRKKKSST